jgi:transposase
VRKAQQPQLVYSKPTMCLHCHLIVEMEHERDADPAKGAWNCPRCGHLYPFMHWKIRKQTQRKQESEAA